MVFHLWNELGVMETIMGVEWKHLLLMNIKRKAGLQMNTMNCMSAFFSLFFLLQYKIQQMHFSY